MAQYLAQVDGPLPYADLIAAGVLGFAGVVWLGDQISDLLQFSKPKRDKDDVDWDVNDHRKDHIWHGSKNAHESGWKKLGFDPKDPNSWKKLLPVLQKVYENGVERQTETRSQGVVHYIYHYVEELGAWIRVVVMERLDGTLILSDASVQ